MTLTLMHGVFFLKVGNVSEATEERVILQFESKHENPLKNWSYEKTNSACPMCNLKHKISYMTRLTQRSLDLEQSGFPVEASVHPNTMQLFLQAEVLRHLPPERLS